MKNSQWLLTTKYPLIDMEGVEWRFKDSRPVSIITDRAMGITPALTTGNDIEKIVVYLDTGYFPDLFFKTQKT